MGTFMALSYIFFRCRTYSIGERNTNLNMKRIIILIPLLLLALFCHAQSADVEALKAKVQPWLVRVKAQPDWLSSRLQMYWETHDTDVYVNGEYFDHVGGQRAPVPTVKMNGGRSHGSEYDRPKLEDVVPYDDDVQGQVTYISKKTGLMERTSPAKTGCNIDAMNRQIAGIARDAAHIYKATGEKQYAELAMGVFSTYMKGIYYRNMPIDLNHGQQQTLVGLATYEVIHEDCSSTMADIYRSLGSYIQTDRPLYEDAFRKWADIIVANGVPHNNWNIIQARFIFAIAQALDSDSHYKDGHGREYYIDLIVNQSSVRQWGLKPLADFGFDLETGIWYESPGYSVGVVADYAQFANDLDSLTGVDIFQQIPTIEKAIFAMCQYLFPNRMIAGFGDTHPYYLRANALNDFLAYARRHGYQDKVARAEQALRAIKPTASAQEAMAFASHKFYAPNVSWSVLRTGMDRMNDLMISVNGSLGNHQHANGISMELYGRGWVLGPDGGIGKTLYSGLDYLEYYSQFPAHNTVCVNGISSYPVMMSAHAFKMQSQWAKEDGTVSTQSVSFHEPESGADQQRQNAVVKTSKCGGYYVDIFRSRVDDKQNPRQKEDTHDYFYHNLGQTMTLTAANGVDLGLKPTDELAFAGGHLYAYSYIYDKKAFTTSKDVRATFTIHPTAATDTRQDITMTMWMQGAEGRTVFQALSPVNMEYERIKEMPYKVIEQPVLTYVARQRGDAWQTPFVAIYSPNAVGSIEPEDIKSVSYFRPKSSDTAAVGVKIELKDGHVDYVFSSATGAKMSYQGMKAEGYLQVIRK